MKALYQFYWDCGRMGGVEGLFIAEPSEVRKAIGKKVYFGEILGKHSDIYGTLNEEDFTLKSVEHDFVQKLEDLLGSNLSGYNPLDYIRDDEDEDEDAVWNG